MSMEATVILRWTNLAKRAEQLALSIAPMAVGVNDLLSQEKYAQASHGGVFYTPETHQLYLLASSDQALLEQLKKTAQQHDPQVQCELRNQHNAPPEAVRIAPATQLWYSEKQSQHLEALRELWRKALQAAEQCKQADEGYSPVLRGLGEVTGYLPGGNLSWTIPGVPRHVQGALGGGLLLGGLGYGLGSLAGRFLAPDDWKRKRLARTGAMLGAGLGVTPAVLATISNWGTSRGLLDDEIFQSPPPYKPPTLGKASASQHSDESRHGGNEGWYDGVEMQHGSGERRYDGGENGYGGGENGYGGGERRLGASPSQTAAPPNQPPISLKIALAELDVELPPHVKAATDQTGVDLNFHPGYVPADHFTRIIWGDPRVSSRLSIPERAVASGLVEAAQIDRQRRGLASSLVYPRDLARITAGMGSGYLSGAVVGKVLGGLLGMPQRTQDRLKEVGLWAGVVKNVLPVVFR